MNSLPDSQPIRGRKINWPIACLFLIIAIACLGLISARTSTGVWDGMFPAGEYHLKVQDENGMPIKAAVLRVFARGTQKVAFGYPIDNYSSDGDLTSDERGVIVALHTPRGFEFGGSCWDLFWIFPMCSGGPKFDFQILADGYKTIKFSTEDLFEPAYNDRRTEDTTIVLENGENVRIPVYELMFTLER